MIFLWWHWALIGFGFLLAELLFPAFVMLWFGLSGLIVMLLLLAVPEAALDIQILLWTVGSIVMTGAWLTFFKRRAPRALTGTAQAALIGEEGIVTARIDRFAPGSVRFQKPLIGSDTWAAMADAPIEVGARVRVTEIQGNKVVVTAKGGV